MRERKSMFFVKKQPSLGIRSAISLKINLKPSFFSACPLELMSKTIVCDDASEIRYTVSMRNHYRGAYHLAPYLLHNQIQILSLALLLASSWQLPLT
jgi:hypothetical protein